MGPERETAQLTIRHAGLPDAAAIAEMYRQVFPGRRLSRFGAPTVQTYFKIALSARQPIALVAQSSGAIKGFAIGYSGQPPVHSRGAMRYLLPLCWQIAIALVRHPSLIREFLQDSSPAPETSSEAPSAWLDAIAVLPASRGHGVGKSLLDAFVRDARETGAGRLLLEADRDVEPALELYRRAGFVETGASARRSLTMSLILGPRDGHV